jgi:hypothetical protein
MSPQHRPWFGAKRMGFGLHPQTWQGWLVMAAIVAAIVSIVRAVG